MFKQMYAMFYKPSMIPT